MRNKLLALAVILGAFAPFAVSACKKSEDPPPMPSSDTPAATTPGPTAPPAPTAPVVGTDPASADAGAGVAVHPAGGPGGGPVVLQIPPNPYVSAMPSGLVLPKGLPTTIQLPPGMVIPGFTPPPQQPPPKK